MVNGEKNGKNFTFCFLSAFSCLTLPVSFYYNILFPAAGHITLSLKRNNCIVYKIISITVKLSADLL